MDFSPIYKRSFWRDYSISLRRFTRDRRARRRLLALTLALLFPLGYIAYLIIAFHAIHDTAFEIGMSCVLAAEFGIIIGVRWKWHREKQRQLAEDIAAADPVLVQRLQKLAYGLAALNERASSELFARYKTLPEGFVVNTRRIHIDLLKEKSVWDDLPSRVRLWLMRPDGGWPPEVALHVRQTEEKLHTLLWALALTHKLRPLETMERPLDFAALGKLLARSAPGIRPTWDLRAERDNALPYFFRLHVESIHRGQRKAQSEEEASSTEARINAIAEGDEEDRLSGSRTIAELDDNSLHQVARSAGCRYQVLSMLLESLHTDRHWKAFASRLFGALPRREHYSVVKEPTAEVR